MDDWGLGAPPAQYGTGASFQSACPPFPAAPTGYVAWNVNVNGAIPSDVQARATALANDLTKPLGYSETIYSGGVPLILRVDAHSWTTDASGNVIAACTHGADVWIPSFGTTTPVPASSSSQSNAFFIFSIGLGAVVSVLSIYEYFNRKKS